MLREEALSVEDAQKLCDRGGAYFIEEVSIEEAQKISLSEFLDKFINNWNNKWNVRFAKSKKIQCATCRYRSITDMTRLAKYYFPDSNVVSVRNALIELADKKKIYGSVCLEVERRVFSMGTGSTTSDRDARDEFGWKFNKIQKKQPTKTNTNVKNDEPAIIEG